MGYSYENVLRFPTPLARRLFHGADGPPQAGAIPPFLFPAGRDSPPHIPGFWAPKYGVSDESRRLMLCKLGSPGLCGIPQAARQRGTPVMPTSPAAERKAVLYAL